jgi:hypothetical protein
MTTTRAAKEKAERPPIPGHVLLLSEEIRREAVDWRPDMPYARRIYLRAASYQAWADAAVPAAAGFRPTLSAAGKYDRVDIGKFVLYKRLLPHIHYATTFVFFRLRSQWAVGSLDLFRCGKPYGEVYFDGDVANPVLANRNLEPWMSPTPSEIMSQRPGIRAARGHVLVAGLGMGWLAGEICRKKGVRSVTVVERDQDIASFFGPGVVGPDGRPVPVRVDDFYATDLSGFDSVIVDIWQGCGDAGWDDDFQKVKRDLADRRVRVWGWGDYVPRG